MTIFVDTSALYALLSADDRRHTDATSFWRHLVEHRQPLLATNYVLLETIALVQSRLGMDAVDDLVSRLQPLLEILWVDAGMDRRGRAALLAARKRDMSLVDCVSFEVMRDRGVEVAFAFDEHFAHHGFHPAS